MPRKPTYVEMEAKELLHKAKQRWPAAEIVQWQGWDDRRGDTYHILDKNRGLIAVGWFGADGNPHTAAHKPAED